MGDLQHKHLHTFYHKRDSLTELAKKRMSAILTHDSLGAGFQLASSDMALRGVGNLLGMEQSGDIDSIGIDRYLEMLELAVNELKTGEQRKSIAQPEICPRKAGIPEEYMPSQNERINFYRSLFKANSEERIKEIFNLTKDLTALAKNLENLYYVSLIKVLLFKINAKSLRQLSEQRRNNSCSKAGKRA